MIEIPEHPKYSENQDRYPCHGGEMPCVICGKAAPNTPYYTLVWGGCHLVTREESEAMGGADDGAYMGAYPIGQDCKRKHPELAAYVYKEKTPKCLNHKRKNAVWSFPYKSNGEDVRAYFCEECANDRDYTMFSQPMEKIG